MIYRPGSLAWMKSVSEKFLGMKSMPYSEDSQQIYSNHIHKMNPQVEYLKQLQARKRALNKELRELKATRHLRPNPYAFFYEVVKDVFSGVYDKK
jgi:ribosomal protein L19E